MVLEAQFGSNIAPIERPKFQKSPKSTTTKTNGATTTTKPKSEPEENQNGIKKEEEDEDQVDFEAQADAELDRLHALGIPVPGIEIKVDKHVARIWLETLEVECAYPVLRDRVRAVVERAVETVADLWSSELATRVKAGGKDGGLTSGKATKEE